MVVAGALEVELAIPVVEVAVLAAQPLEVVQQLTLEQLGARRFLRGRALERLQPRTPEAGAVQPQHLRVGRPFLAVEVVEAVVGAVVALYSALRVGVEAGRLQTRIPGRPLKVLRAA